MNEKGEIFGVGNCFYRSPRSPQNGGFRKTNGEEDGSGRLCDKNWSLRQFSNSFHGERFSQRLSTMKSVTIMSVVLFLKHFN